MADWAMSVRQEVEQEVEQSLVCHQLLCLPYQLCSNQLLKLTKHRISAIKGKNTIMGQGSTPYNGVCREAPPKGGILFSGFRQTKGSGFHLLTYMKGQGQLSFWSVKSHKRANRCILQLRRLYNECITAVERDAKF